MAWTNTKMAAIKAGNANVFIRHIVPDSATEAVQTGLKYIYGFSFGYNSMNSLGHFGHPNVDASGDVANGTIGLSGFTTGDDFYLTVWGR